MDDGHHKRHAARQGSATNHARRARPTRIVIVDDQLPSCKACGIIIQRLFRKVTILTFQNRDLAWQELLRRDPNLLITDLNNENVPGQPDYTGMSGEELLGLLAKREVKYPVMVVSGSLLAPGMESQARECAGPVLKLTFLAKPFAAQIFQDEAMRLLKGG